MRKMLATILSIGIIAVLFTTVAHAQTDCDYGYVVVKCTVTVDVDVLDDWATAWFISIGNMTNGLSPDQQYVSVSSIAVKNNSSGAVLKYAVRVSTIQRTPDGGSTWVTDSDDTDNGIKGWILSSDGTADSVGEFILEAVFAISRPALGDFAEDDRFTAQEPDATLNVYTYKTGGDKFDPANTAIRYPSALSNSSGINLVAPNVNDPRGLWFRIHTPKAVTDTYPRRICIRVDGGLANAW